MVAKRLQRKEHATKEDMLPFCRSTVMAVSFRDSFMAALRKRGDPLHWKLNFVPCYLYEYEHAGSTCYFVGEQKLDGDFIKFNNNAGWKNEDPKYSGISEFMQAFSHFTFIQSGSLYMVVDLQGTVDSGTLLLTDPQVISQKKAGEKSPFGHGDLGPVGFKYFMSNHSCGPTCRLLQLQQGFDSLLLSLDPGSLRRAERRSGPGGVIRPLQSASATVHRQRGGTCYANAVATIVRAAESRIIGRRVCPHSSMVDEIVKVHGSSGGDPERVLRLLCPGKCLRFRKLDVEGMLECIKNDRPVLWSFWLCDAEWDEFSAFFRRSPRGVLSRLFKSELRVGSSRIGHACVIESCQGRDLQCKNSWGSNFAADGRFHVDVALVSSPMLASTFIDVYYLEADLRDEDRAAYERAQRWLLNGLR
ncbi:unnamed protein product [Prorocentrum cordatum]|uniref:Alpha-type protein kinase domain-containing protein n=1 Tax=Prorocentrum cordatum TaxID=2364126 RepID=A0ABN9X392_9DINO|nr:unnamed protein product [Polarella glacialis]